MKQIQKANSTDPYIIAIGASAGGMEAIHLLFDHTPEDGVAYVIIQHLSPDHKSFMAELLEKHSKLQISIAENEMLVEPNRVYLMPRGKNMTIKNRRLLLTEIRALQPNTAIDIFLDSLAEDQKEKSIAIILSGTGTDGTKGIASIKRNGGFVIAQDPQSAKFNGMPNSAIQSGNVDLVRSPELIPEEIIAHLHQDTLETNYTNQLSDNDESALIRILDLIQEHTPLDFTDYKRPTIIRRIVLRMTKNKVHSLDAYADFLDENHAEINILTKEFLISVTQFFRDKEAFEILKEKVIPEIIANKLQVDTLKLWVVGCATGEEAYSLAILIMEHLTEIKKNLEVKIFASDIDKNALHHASKGVYSENITKDVSEERLNNFFNKHNDSGYKVRENIRKMIIFADHDIVKQPPYGKIDLISCRNMLIYINPILQNKILASLHFCLNMGGYLFLGPSESLGEMKKSFSEVDKKWKIFKSIEVARNLRNTTYSTPGLESRLVNIKRNTAPQRNSIKGNLSEFLNSTLLEESGYDAAIWIDTDFEIIQTHGDHEKYLLPKIFNFNLLEMLPEELSIVTSTTTRKAIKNNRIAIIEKINFKKDDKLHSVNIFVKPFISEDPNTQNVILVLFNSKKTTDNADKYTGVFELEAQTAQRIEDMAEELTEAKLKLKDAYDLLDESHDNISSYNEELISSNEEMQSTNEELQSVNEELQTVNNEYQEKIKELAELNDDLNNYFKSTINAQLYVDKNMILRKFTPSAIHQVNIKDSDIGRSLRDISTNIKFSTLMEDIASVIADSLKIKKEIQTMDGRWYNMVAIPYIRQFDNQTDGVIITFNDISELKRVQNKLSRINEDNDTFIYAASHDLKGPLINLSSLVLHLRDSIDLETEQAEETIDMIISCVSSLSEVVNELSEITKFENEEDTIESINLEDLIKEVELGMNALIMSTGATINLELNVTEIIFSKKNLRRVISNLLGNAVKYRSPNRPPEVKINTKISGNYILLTIKDNGIGIPENKIHKVFGMFQRAHHHTEGSGIGLYLVKKVITNVGGDIEVESEFGKGTVFKVYFPNGKRNNMD